MPSIEQLQELQNKCTWEKKSRNGVNGQLVTGPNGNTLFLPAAGLHRKDAPPYTVGNYGYYYSRERSSSGSYGTCYLYFHDSFIGWSYYYPEYRRSVRAVRVSQN